MSIGGYNRLRGRGVGAERTLMMKPRGSRGELQRKRQQMRETLLVWCREGRLRSGDMMPPLRVLAREHGMAPATVQRVVQELVAEGVLQVRQGSGTFVARQPVKSQDLFLFVSPYNLAHACFAHYRSFQVGFENRVAQNGGSCVTLSTLEAQEFLAGQDQNGAVVAASGAGLAGVCMVLPTETRAQSPQAWSACDELLRLPVPRVVPAPLSELVSVRDLDVVDFDDRDGARQAVDHLVHRGHRHIAFLGLHADALDERFAWSREREIGWREAMKAKGLEPQGLSFCPSERGGLTLDEQRQGARRASEALLPRLNPNDVTAVVTVNFYAGQALAQQMREIGLNRERWPATVSFDDEPSDSHVVSALRLSWDDLGREAAECLTRRGRETIVDEARDDGPRVHWVPMRLIPRLTCHATRFQTLEDLTIYRSASGADQALRPREIQPERQVT